MSRRLTQRETRQGGVTLIVVLLILVVVTIVGLGAAQIALLGERSTRYDRDYLIASQAAEAALMDAEFDIRGPNTAVTSRVAKFNPANDEDNFKAGCGNDLTTRGLCKPNDVKPVWATVSFMEQGATAHSAEFGEFTGRNFDAGESGVKPDRKPRYIIEVVTVSYMAGQDASSKAAPLQMYRITAIGFGPRPDIQVVMQISFRKEV